ncbi:MAG: serpin family protein [Myxococcota bacterium]|nr:serpin family protein [Myxococcota bacterium]MDW8363818.1 serpin family protein [Myxococcales bacterium]
MQAGSFRVAVSMGILVLGVACREGSGCGSTSGGGGSTRVAKAPPVEQAAPRPAPHASPQPEETSPVVSDPIADDAELARAVESVAQGLNHFSVALHRLVSDPHANAVTSPWSITRGLLMLREGARERTRAEIDRALHLTNVPERVLGALCKRTRALSSQGVTLRHAGGLFVGEGLPVQPELATSLREVLGESLRTVPFHDAERARLEIHRLVEEQTGGRTRELLPPGLVPSDTRMLLVDALYFAGAWENRFDRYRTTPRPFYVDGRAPVPVPTMHGEFPMRWGRVGSAVVGELPYVGRAAAMVIVVPGTYAGLPDLFEGLNEAKLRRFVDALRPRPEVRVRLPRFRIASPSGLTLRDPMRRLGIRQLFEPGVADLSGIARVDPPLHLENGYHRAVVEVNEEGTEAAAETAYALSARPGRHDDDTLFADRPFLFFVRDSRTGLVLLLGHVVDPR